MSDDKYDLVLQQLRVVNAIHGLERAQAEISKLLWWSDCRGDSYMTEELDTVNGALVRGIEVLERACAGLECRVKGLSGGVRDE